MKQEIIVTIIMAFAFICTFAIAEVLYHFLKVKGEFTRKFVHITCGLLALLFPIVLDNHWYILLLSINFFTILLISKKYGLLPSIHGVERFTLGSYLLPLSIYGCFLVSQFYQHYLFFYVPIVVLAISDPVAALSGTIWKVYYSNSGTYSTSKHSKTFFGTFMFFISAVLISVFLFLRISDIHILTLIAISVLIGLSGAAVEAISYKGWDNFSVPLIVAVILVIFRNVLF